MATIPSPRTWSTGDTPTDTQLNTDLRDAYGFLMNPPRVKVYSNAGQSFATSEGIITNWDTQVYDSDGMWSSGAASKLVAVTAGWYEVILHLNWEVYNNSNPGNRFAAVKKNAASDPDIDAGGRAAIVGEDSQFLSPSSSDPQTNHICTIVRLSAADYLEAVAYNTVSTSRSIIVSGVPAETFFGMRWMAAL